MDNPRANIFGWQPCAAAPPAGFSLADVSAATRAFVESHHPELMEAMEYGSLTLITSNAPAPAPLAPSAQPSDQQPAINTHTTLADSGTQPQQRQLQQQQQVVPKRQRQLPDEIWILGTAHVSRKSALHVKQAILHLRPQGVAVELCPARKMMLFQLDPDDADSAQGRGSSSPTQDPAPSTHHTHQHPGSAAGTHVQQQHPTTVSDAEAAHSLASATAADPMPNTGGVDVGSRSSPGGGPLPAHPRRSLPSHPLDDLTASSHPLESSEESTAASSAPVPEDGNQESCPLYSSPAPASEAEPSVQALVTPPPATAATAVKPATPNLLQLVLKARADGQNILTALLSGLMAQCAAQLGTTLGLEFIKAHQAVLQLNREPGCTRLTQLTLADVPVDLTLRRSWGVLARLQKLTVVWHILTALVFGKVGSAAQEARAVVRQCFTPAHGSPWKAHTSAQQPVGNLRVCPRITAEDLDELMQEDVMEGALKDLSGRFPSLLGPLLHERNHHMANVLECLALAGMRRRVVLVCGKAHVAGIVHCLLQG
ncbi:MAG: hypothetical protein WDW36_009561 [Sanguina aurantia]